jgi:hypothetical protein
MAFRVAMEVVTNFSLSSVFGENRCGVTVPLSRTVPKIRCAMKNPTMVETTMMIPNTGGAWGIRPNNRSKANP